ncbi:21348_t:CDS:2 [Cetraspora pellucida]|uniref:21348_t:CDS:1 n=1 Tax=Cetraspora pellucida TaxID=1433469 RepID=A0A9N9K8L6_9GLOM|nr:21348_t:CDS:2 [Cetraspora pellucida]
MNTIILLPNTIQALQNFISIWRQDPAAQYNLEIFSQNLEETALNEIDQLIRSLDEPINNSIPILEEELN